MDPLINAKQIASHRLTSCSLRRSPMRFKFSPSNCKCAAASKDNVENFTFSYGLTANDFGFDTDWLTVAMQPNLFAASLEADSFSLSFCCSWVCSTARRARRRQLYFSLLGTSAQRLAKRWAYEEVFTVGWDSFMRAR